MASPFKIYDVTGGATDRPESLGTKEKFWIMPPEGRGLEQSPYLFKIGRTNTGEAWAEKFCSEVLAHVGIPAAEYEFATHEGQFGVASKRFMAHNASFWPANAFLSKIVAQYDGTVRFKQRRYQLPSSIGLLRSGRYSAPTSSRPEFANLSAENFFIGYLVFDALVGNTDRHHENWGIVIEYRIDDEPLARLAPTFDHASSLGRELTDESRLKRLITKDERQTVAAYASKARSAFFQSANSSRSMLQTETLGELVRSFPEETRLWAGLLCELPAGVFQGILDRIDASLMSDAAKEFTMTMLKINQNMIREVVHV
ncbi:HipA domain-containing protein [Rhodopseudomonas palustris]